MSTEHTGTRLNKYISETGFCSRREADRLIEQGSVSVNGSVAEMGMRVTDADQVNIDGRPLKAKPRTVYLAYFKPTGVTCTTDTSDPDNIVDAVRYRERIFPIGRLDKFSDGLIFLTNDGDIVNKILRAGNSHEKEYLVMVDQDITPAFIAEMSSGVPILGTVTQPCPVTQTGPASFRIILTQGMNRQIRRMAECLGYRVLSLRRVRVMNITLDGMKSGQWRELTATEVAEIERMVANSSKTEEASLPRVRRTASASGPRAGKGPYPERTSRAVPPAQPTKAPQNSAAPTKEAPINPWRRPPGKPAR